MTKKEFIQSLKEKLEQSTNQEISDILMDYNTKIDMKQTEGLSESEAVASLGDINTLTNKILESNFQQDKIESKLISAFDQIENFFSSIKMLEWNQLAHLAFDSFIVLFLLMVGRWITVDFAWTILLGNLLSLINIEVYWIEIVLTAIVRVAYFMFAMYFLFAIVKRRYVHYKNKETQVKLIDDMKSVWYGVDYENLNKNAGQNIVIKILLVLCFIPVLCMTVCGTGAFIIYLDYCYVYHVVSIGIFMFAIGLLLFCISISCMFYKLWSQKVRI